MYWDPPDLHCAPFLLEDMKECTRTCGSTNHYCNTSRLMLDMRTPEVHASQKSAQAPCVNVCPGVTVEIVGFPSVTWTGSNNHTGSNPAEQALEPRLLFDVKAGGALLMTRLSVNRTVYEENPAPDRRADTQVTAQNAVRIGNNGSAVVDGCIFRGVQLYVHPGATALNLTSTALVPFVEQFEKAESASQFQLHASSISVCGFHEESMADGLCKDDEIGPIQAQATFYVVSSVLALSYFRTPQPAPDFPHIHLAFKDSTFFMSSRIGAKEVPDGSKKLLLFDAMDDDASTTMPLFPVNRNILLNEDKQVAVKGLLSATFEGCVLAGCSDRWTKSSPSSFCEPPTGTSSQVPGKSPGNISFASIRSTLSGSIDINLTTSTPTFGDRKFSLDVQRGMDVNIFSESNTSKGSPFFLRAMFHRRAVHRVGIGEFPEKWFFTGGHLRIENVRLDWLGGDDQARGVHSWLPYAGDNNVGDITDGSASLLIARSFLLYAQVFRQQCTTINGCTETPSAEDGCHKPPCGMPNYASIVTLRDVKIASFNGVHCGDEKPPPPDDQEPPGDEKPVADSCTDDENKVVMTANTTTEDGDKFLNVTLTETHAQAANTFQAWQAGTGDQLFDFDTSIWGTYNRSSSAHEASNDLMLGGKNVRWGVAPSSHLRLYNLWFVPDLQKASTADVCCGSGEPCQPTENGELKWQDGHDGGPDLTCISPFDSNQPVSEEKHGGSISFRGVAIQWKRAQIRLDESERAAGVDILPLNIWNSPNIRFEGCEFARSANAENPRAIFADFDLDSSKSLTEIGLVAPSPNIMLDLRQSQRRVRINGDSKLPMLWLRRLLLPEAGLALSKVTLALSLDAPAPRGGAAQPPVIDMTDTVIWPCEPDNEGDALAPHGMWTGLTRWDSQSCLDEGTWCAKMEKVALILQLQNRTGQRCGPGSSRAVINTDTGGLRKLRIDKVSGDGLNVTLAAQSATAGGAGGPPTLHVSGVNGSVSCVTGDNGTATRNPMLDVSLHELQQQCVGKTCLFEHVSLRSGSYDCTDRCRAAGLHATCDAGGVRGVRCNDCDLLLDSSSCVGPTDCKIRQQDSAGTGSCSDMVHDSRCTEKWGAHGQN